VEHTAKLRRAVLPALTTTELLAFFSKVSETGTTAKSCWEWTGYRDKDGYGMFGLRGAGRRAHCVAWTLDHGQIPDGAEIDHLCRNRACVRPSHLELVTHRENILRGNHHRERMPNGHFAKAAT
jgi:hypothetical protein